MRRGLKCRLWATYLIQIKQKQKLPRRGKTGQLAGLAGQGTARQGMTGHDKAGTGYTQGEMMTNWHRTANTRRL